MVDIHLATERVRFTFAVALAGVVSAAITAAVAPTATTQAVIVLAALAAAAGLAGVQSLLAVPGPGRQSMRASRCADVVPLVLSGRCTDVVHHPVRPRAPGLV